MKVLWLYKFDPAYNIDHWLHLDFVRAMRQAGVDVVAYGPRVHEAYPDITEIAYSPAHTWDNLMRQMHIDIAVFNTKSRMFGYYHPRQNKAYDCWVPRGWDHSAIVPKIMLEEDYHYEPDDSWYREHGFCVIIHRHLANSRRDKQSIPHIWLPFSVDTTVFRPAVPDRGRTRRICFAGSMSPPYPARAAACAALNKVNMIDAFGGHQHTGSAYVQCMQQYVSHISTASIYQITPAKVFEITASGSVLLTTWFPGLEELLPEGGYVTFQPDASDIVKKAERIIRDQEYARDIAQKGMAWTRQHHNHVQRIAQLRKLLEQLRIGCILPAATST